MEQIQALKQMEGMLSLISNHASALSAKLEDLLFRAQRIAHALKGKAVVSDTMFGYDLQNFRAEVRRFSNEVSGIPGSLGSLDRSSVPEEDAITHAQAVMRLSDRLRKELSALHDEALLAHQHIRQSEHKMEAWYLLQETEALAQLAQPLPGIANKILIKVSSPAQA